MKGGHLTLAVPDLPYFRDRHTENNSGAEQMTMTLANIFLSLHSPEPVTVTSFTLFISLSFCSRQ